MKESHLLHFGRHDTERRRDTAKNGAINIEHEGDQERPERIPESCVIPDAVGRERGTSTKPSMVKALLATTIGSSSRSTFGAAGSHSGATCKDPALSSTSTASFSSSDLSSSTNSGVEPAPVRASQPVAHLLALENGIVMGTWNMQTVFGSIHEPPVEESLQAGAHQKDQCQVRLVLFARAPWQ